jgi:hypothetical protein
VVWRSAFPREEKLFPWKKDKEVLDWLLRLPHSARLTSKISQLKNYRNFRLGELDTAVRLDLRRRCQCQARNLCVVAYSRADVIRNDHTGNLREAIGERSRVSSRPLAKLGVVGANQPSSTGSGGGNSEIIRGRCAERQMDHLLIWATRPNGVATCCIEPGTSPGTREHLEDFHTTSSTPPRS